jgi:regulator of protease activity HflC (stomatin/prohibitin superfamily)
MIGFFGFVLFVVLAVVAFIFAFRGKLLDLDDIDVRRGERAPRGVSWAGVILGVVFFGAALLMTGFHQIEAGYVGVVKQLGAVTGQVLPPGLTWVTPFVSSIEDVDTRVRPIHIADDPNTPDKNEDYQAASKEQQDLFLKMTFTYHVDPQTAPTIIQNIGQDFEAKVVLPRLLDLPKSVTDDYPTAIVLNSREEIRQKSIDLLTDALAPFGFIVDNLAIENFSYSPEYNASIEAKQIAQQQVETEKQKLAQQGIIAEQRVAEAKGLADAQIERARGEAEANSLVARSLTEEILLNRYIEKLAPGIQSIVIPSESGTILSLGDLLKPTPAAGP